MKNGYFFAEACRNTFLIFDCMSLKSLNEAFIEKAHACLIKEKKDDSMILVDGQAKDDSLYARMLVLGVDGTFGEFCGNGSRACAAYLFAHYPKYKQFYLVSNRGVHQLLRYHDGIYSTQLPHINFELNPKFIAQPDLFHKEGHFHTFLFEGKHLIYAEAIEPHLIVQEEISDKELVQLGKKLNDRKDIFPLNINVNSIKQIKKNNTIRVRTFERGVQRLTESCGTGSSCSAAWYLNNKPGTLQVITMGGRMMITINAEGLQLKGSAIIETFHPFDQNTNANS